VSEIDDGGGAFPHGDPTHGGDLGMTLRDYFAAAALTGFVTNNGTDFTSIKLAEWSYSQADAMIEARKGES
jgi:hypothetical protein